MNKKELIEVVYEEMNKEITKGACTRMVNKVLDSVTETLKNGEEFNIAGFGSFKVKDVAGRTGRNPQTGDSIQIPARKRVKFTAGKFLKDSVQ